ncbi:MAG TPA: alpha/beta hydrolase [Mycobacteriales bacterium]|nr:alpha/beta hydrolase [Mycobacteriales bacterium]
MSLQVTTRHGSVELDRIGSGEPVLLLHGIPGSRASWTAVVDLLSAHAGLLVPDLLGFGGSSRPRDVRQLHAEGQAEALLDVLDSLDVSTVTVVAHDFGGPVALRLLDLAPDRVTRLGLLSTNAFTDTPIPVPLNTLTWPVVGPLMEKVLMSGPSLRLMLRAGTGCGSDRLDAHTHLGDASQRQSITTIFSASLRDLVTLYAPVEVAIRAADVPGFVAWGDRDPFFSIAQGRRTAEALRAPFLLLTGAGHFLPQERPVEVASAVRHLLGEHVPDTAGRS